MDTNRLEGLIQLRSIRVRRKPWAACADLADSDNSNVKVFAGNRLPAGHSGAAKTKSVRVGNQMG